MPNRLPFAIIWEAYHHDQETKHAATNATFLKNGCRSLQSRCAIFRIALFKVSDNRVVIETNHRPFHSG